METEDSTSSLSSADVSTAFPAASVLCKFDVAALRRDFDRLSVDDLTALASFPAEPHELIGRIVAVTHCLLLSLASEHTKLELRAPPWPLLRLQLLDNTAKIWRKLRKRAWQLEAGSKLLSPAQIHFGCTELVPFILPPKPGNHRSYTSWQLERVAQVSTIAASLGAWGIFCLCCCVLPKSSRLRLQPSLEIKDQDVPLSGITSLTRVKKNNVGVKLGSIPVHNRCLQSSRRIGVKVGGRFLLCYTRFPAYSSSHTINPFETFGEWSTYCLERNRTGRTLYSLNDTSWCKPLHAIETELPQKTQPVALCYMPPLAQQSLLLQLGFHEHVFERPAQEFPYIKRLQPVLPTFTLKLAVISIDSTSQLTLVGIGNVWITMKTTVADLRSQVTPSISSHLLQVFSNVDTQGNFRFIYRGSILAVSQERYLAALTLLPFTLLVVASNFHAKEIRRHSCSSQFWRHHCEVSQSLVNAGLPDHISNLQAPGSSITIPMEPQIYAMHQPLEISTTSHIVEIFTHWQAFVCFQQLQDSSVLFQLPQRTKKHVKSLSKPPRHRQKEQDDDRDESIPYGPQPQQLPRKKFNSNKEWLMPLYAVVDVKSPITAVLKTPFRQDVENTLEAPCRLVMAEEPNVIHFTRINFVTAEHDESGVPHAVFEIAFLRDESCPLESFVTLTNAYVWRITPRKAHTNREISALPTKWMLDLYRFVQHPTYDFQSPMCQLRTFFRVKVPWVSAERAIEAAFWSKDVDWTPSVSSTDLYSVILRPIFDTLCRSHPPAFGVDSVKFSKLLYETNIQPKLLSIGDAAFLFASKTTPGFNEMDFNGFVRAIEWLAQQFYSDNTKTRTKPGIQHTMLLWRRENARGLQDSLRRFCFETLVHLPCLASIWHEIMESWRIERKQQLLQEYALKYCAATRLRANWIGFVTWRIYLRRRQRMKEERMAATEIQSLVRGRKQYLEYQRVRQIVVRTQRRVHARSELRRLRVERKIFIDRMRLRLVKWTRHHLWILSAWKRVNAVRAARRDRIREKRSRRIGVAIFPLDTRRLRFSLYRAKPVASKDPEKQADSFEMSSTKAAEYELEVVDPARSWCHVFCVSQQEIDQFISEETERQSLQLQLGFTTAALAEKQASSSVTPQVQTKQVKAAVVRDSVPYPVLKPNIMLLALARRLFILNGMQQSLRCYTDPSDTSQGKVIFKGAVRSELVQDNEVAVQRHIIHVLEWVGTFKLLTYTPATSIKRRYDLDAAFILMVLEFSRFQSMRLRINEDEEAIAEDSDKQSLRTGDEQQFIPHQIHRILTGPHKLLAFQCIISYVLKYGVRTPTYSMMPHVIAERERQREEQESRQRDAVINLERKLVVKIQSRFRQHLARKIRLQLALTAYFKQFDRERGRFVYVFQYLQGERIVLEQKPFSLFDQDVPLPPDEWQLVDNNVQFFNPRRGICSRFNDNLAATVIQRWYRKKMWHGMNKWSLRDLASALRYHDSTQKPLNMTDPGQLENIKLHALQLHVLKHQYKEAYPVYEAALKLSPRDPQTLVCLALLLVISCRYPAAKSWQCAMTLLQQARDTDDDLTSTLHDIELYFFRWALLLQPKNSQTIANYAVYLQCVHLDIDKAELLYRRALDLDPTNDLIVTNFQRLQSERAPGRLYGFAGPGATTLARSSEIRRCGSWREMEDPEAQSLMPTRFFHSLRTGKCTWERPIEKDNPVECLLDRTQIVSSLTDTYP
ncbi:hypothetical protein PPTG_00860 [Phytophthora nicotianae INRA-310]|uniref:WW domain-containing protein n=1 Tax=Phytophthora nicotianae (strain INRA-310) TaxID=761204 RepID=W2RGQ9_PHYN3|nr:hypothetical protein PPTG_00860 [Phytophthora nicotianae INRA-310]ETN24623.1 hypothetical protein PPTG_00860 [Phytophthora nicotianae INRA-310]